VELRWTDTALADLDSAGAFLAEHHSNSGPAMARRILEAVDYLLRHPNLGRPGRVRATRELVVSGTPFIVVYRVRVDEVQLLGVLHHARKWP
jgi:plasmid stabilization system protein ParE